jgi:very-short-patch-repair endonuclease
MANLHARGLRNSTTEAERRLWRHLREVKLAGTHFRRQVPIGNFIVDFCCHAAKVVIEVDGGQHNEDGVALQDSVRIEWLSSRGYRVLRFWNNEVLANTDRVAETILSVLKQTPTPTPPRKGEGLSG